jgi:hypothetical protein
MLGTLVPSRDVTDTFPLGNGMDMPTEGWRAGVQVPVGLEIFLVFISSRPILWLTQFPIQWVTEALSGGKAAEA